MLIHGAWFVLLSFWTTGLSFGFNAAESFAFFMYIFFGLPEVSVFPNAAESIFLRFKVSGTTFLIWGRGPKGIVTCAVALCIVSSNSFRRDGSWNFFQRALSAVCAAQSEALVESVMNCSLTRYPGIRFVFAMSVASLTRAAVNVSRRYFSTSRLPIRQAHVAPNPAF